MTDPTTAATCEPVFQVVSTIEFSNLQRLGSTPRRIGFVFLTLALGLASCSSNSNSGNNGGNNGGSSSGGVTSSGGNSSAGASGSNAGGSASGGSGGGAGTSETGGGSGGVTALTSASGGKVGSGGSSSTGGHSGGSAGSGGGQTGSGAGGILGSGGAMDSSMGGAPPGSGGATKSGSGGVAGSVGAGGGGGSGATVEHAGGTGGGSAMGDAGGGSFTLTSTDLVDGAHFDAKFTCAASNGTFGSGVNPELDWNVGVPDGTKSFAITFIDTTLGDTNSMGQHWAIWNIPATVTVFPQGTATLTGDLAAAKQSGKFLTPCAQSVVNNMDDQYEFTVYALSSATLNITGTTVANALTALKAITPLGTAKLDGHAGLKGM